MSRSRSHDARRQAVTRKMPLSIVVATRNRSHLLPGLFDSLRDPVAHGGVAEVIVVDNGSSDATAAVVEAGRAGLPALRYVHEATPGLSRARNAGAAAASGAIVAYLDDDARPRPGWAEALAAAFADPAVVGVGGRIHLRWPPSGAPAWMSDPIASYFSGFDLGEDDRDLAPGEYPVGANMAVRRCAWEAVGGFDVRVARVGNNEMAGEEQVFFTAVQERVGGALRYCARAAADHLIPPDRVSRSFVVRRAFHYGRSRRQLEELDGDVGSGTARVRSEGVSFVRRPKSTLRELYGSAPASATTTYVATRVASVLGYLAP